MDADFILCNSCDVSSNWKEICNLELVTPSRNGNSELRNV
jgi:hypothetical protein